MDVFKMKLHLKLTLFITLCIVVSCSKSDTIKSGDIVFRGATQSDLSEAINEVTQTTKATSYSHIGMCSIEDDTVFVYHSDLGKGVVREPLELFLNPKDTAIYTVDLYRIKNLIEPQVKAAVTKAKSLLGASYNTTYILEDEGYYCSEYVYELFSKDSIFSLEPMTFKDPKTNTFHQGWITHYNDLGIDIPEGKLGCNPNGMANSNRLTFVKQLQ